jgi:NADH dehydrogenase
MVIKETIMKNTPKQIVLIGGGYASVWAYRSIVEELMIEMMMGLVKIKVICPDDFHFFHGWTAESLTGIIRDGNRMSPLDRIFECAEIIKGRAVQMDTISHIIYVKMNDGDLWAVPYDQLLLGMGSSDTSAIEGLVEHAYQLKSHSAYTCTKLRIKFLVQQAAEADTHTASKMLRFAIAGCGFTGIEIAANLAEMIDVLRKNYPALRNVKPSIYLINSRHELLPGLQDGLSRLRQYAEKILHCYGIEVLHQKKIVRVTAQGVYLNDGSFIESRMVITTIGQSRIVLEGTLNLKRDTENRILTNCFLQVNDHPSIWGAGDAVHVTHSKSMQACPSNALWAIKQGQHAGKNIARAILSQPFKPFTYKGLGQCASLGIGKGIGELYGIQFTGWLAWVMRWFFFQHFMPLKKIMWQEIADWVYLLITRKRKDLKIIKNKTHDSIYPEWMQSRELKHLVYQN